MVKRRVVGFFIALVAFAILLFIIQGLYFRGITGGVVSQNSLSGYGNISFKIISSEVSGSKVFVESLVTNNAPNGMNVDLSYKLLDANFNEVLSGKREFFVSGGDSLRYPFNFFTDKVDSGIYSLYVSASSQGNFSEDSVRQIAISKNSITGAVAGQTVSRNFDFVAIILVAVLFFAFYRAYSFRKSARKLSSRIDDRFIKLDV